MYVCVFVFNCPALIVYYVSQSRTPSSCLPTVYRGAVLAFCRCCHPTGRWLAALKAEKHGLIEEPLMGAVFESVARRTVFPATNAIRV